MPTVYDEVEARERAQWTAAEPTWALWDVLRGGTDAAHAIAERMGLSYTDTRALGELAESGEPLGPVELGHRLGMRSASATELVDRLEHGGYVRRTRHATDRRRIVVELTERGRQEALDAIAPMLERFDRIAAGLGEHQAATVTAYLRAIAAEQRAFAAESRE